MIPSAPRPPGSAAHAPPTGGAGCPGRTPVVTAALHGTRRLRPLAGSSPGMAALARAARTRALRVTGTPYVEAGAPRVEGVSRSSETLLDLSLSRWRPRPRRRAAHGPRPAAHPAGRPRDAGARARRGQRRGRRGRRAGHAAPASAPHRGDLAALGLFLGQDEEGTAYVAVVGDPVRRGGAAGLAHAARGRGPARRPRRRPVHQRAGPGQLARHAHPLPPLRRADRARAGRLAAALHGRRQRALPAHRPRGDHGGRRRRRPAAAGPRRAAGVEGRFSVLAGFVEPGESLRAAVAREVREEVGLAVERRALSRQPAVAVPVLADGRLHRDRQRTTTCSWTTTRSSRRVWFTREELAREVGGGSDRLSPRLSIARRLIEHWYGGELHQDVEMDRARTGRSTRRADHDRPRPEAAGGRASRATCRPRSPRSSATAGPSCCPT